jgi:hypothetical protein
MKNLLAAVLFFIALPVSSQSYFQKEFENTIHGISTIIDVEKKTSTSLSKTFGSGFFYHQYKGVKSGSPEYNSNSVDSTLEGIWLITKQACDFWKSQLHEVKAAVPISHTILYSASRRRS